MAAVPAMKEPMAEMASASPARPCLVIWWPSTAVSTEEASPGTFSRMLVTDPPYMAP